MSMHMFAYSSHRAEWKIETVWVTGWFPMTTPAHAPAQLEWLLWPHLYHNTAPQWIKGCRGQRESLAVKHKGSSDPTHYLSWTEADITGIYKRQHIRSGPGLWLLPDNHSLHPDAHQAHTVAPPALHHSSTLWQGQQKLRGELSCETHRQLYPEQHLIRLRTAITCPYSGSTSEVVWVTDYGQGWQRPCPEPKWAHTPVLLIQHYSCLGWGCQCWKWGSTHLKGTEPAWTELSGLLLQQLGTWPCPQ